LQFDFWGLNQSDTDVWVEILSNRALWQNVKGDPPFGHMKMKDVKDGGKIIGSERIAVMAALNIAHELLAYKRQNADYTKTIDKTVQRLRNKLEQALTSSKQLEMHQ
jgi:hypothetical protein